MIGTLLAFLFVALLPVYANAASCTDGTDCYCDLVASGGDLEDTSLLFCEDYEDPAYHDDVSGAWYEGPPGDPGFRGGGNKWMQVYTGTTTGNWRLGQPASPTLGSTCDYGVCGPSEWRADDLWQGNTQAVLDIQQAGEQDDEISGLTLNSLHGGNRWMAWRVPFGKATGIMGEIDFASTSEIGFTALVAYSSDLATAVDPTDWDGDFVKQPWKHEEWGGGLGTLFMGNVGGGGKPFSPGLFHSSEAACNAMRTGATISPGTASCSSSTLKVGSNFDRSDQWPLGTWACVRGHIEGMNTSSGSMTIWFNDEKIFEMTDADLASGLLETSFSGFSPNHYFNGNAGREFDTPALHTFYRYGDNMHIRSGVPVSCGQIGFDVGPTPTPTVSPTTGPTGTPTVSPTPTLSPTVSPTTGPTGTPTTSPTPTVSPTTSPSPTASPTGVPGTLFWFTDFEDVTESNCDGDSASYNDTDCQAGNYDGQHASPAPVPISGSYSGRAYGDSDTYAHVDAAAAGHTDVYMDFEITVASHTSSTDRRVMNISTDAGNWHCSLSLSHTGVDTFTAKVQSSGVTASGTSDSLSDDTVYQVRLVRDKVDDTAPNGHFDCTLYIDSDGDFGNGDLNGGGKTHSATAYPSADQDASGFWHAGHASGAWDSDIDDIGLCDLPATPGVRCVVYQPTASPTVSPTTSPSPTVSPTAAPTATPTPTPAPKRLLIIGRNN